MNRLLEVGNLEGVVSRRLAVYGQLAAVPPRAVVFTGSSQIREAVDVGALEGPALNIGASAKNPCRALPELEALLAAEPETVVIGVSYLDFMGSSCDVPHADLVGASGGALPAGAHGVLDDGDEDDLIYGARWPLGATRAWIVPMLRRAVLNTEPLTPDFDRPWRYNEEAPESVSTLIARDIADPGRLFAPTEGCAAERALRLVVDTLRGAEVRVVLVLMPLHPEVTAARRPDDAPPALRALVRRIAEPHEIRVIDLEDRAQPEWFFDVTHLNADGRAWFTSTLADELGGRSEERAR